MTKDKNSRRTRAREERRRRRLPPCAVCISCGENSPEALEMHHPLGRAHEPTLTVALCKNCHAKATEGQLREEVPLSAADNFMDRLAGCLAALAAFFRLLADSLDRLVGQIREEAPRLTCVEPRGV